MSPREREWNPAMFLHPPSLLWAPLFNIGQHILLKINNFNRQKNSILQQFLSFDPAVMKNINSGMSEYQTQGSVSKAQWTHRPADWASCAYISLEPLLERCVQCGMFALCLFPCLSDQFFICTKGDIFQHDCTAWFFAFPVVMPYLVFLVWVSKSLFFFY